MTRKQEQEQERREFAEFARAKQEMQDAKDRVAEAALNLDYLYSANNQEWTIPFGQDFEEFHLAVCDLRRLKGEA